MSLRPFAVVVLALGLPASAPAEDENTALARASVRGYTQHLDSFTQFSCRWESYGRTASSRTADEWFKDGPVGKKRTATYHQDGDLWVYKQEGQPELPQLPQALPSGKKGAFLVPREVFNRYAGDARLIFNYEVGARTAELYEDETSHMERELRFSDLFSPLHHCGFRECQKLQNVDVQVREVERIGRKWTASGRAVVNGVECVAVCTEHDEFRIVFHLAPKQGFLPIRIELFDKRDGKPELHIQQDILEVKDCGSGRFFPALIRHARRQQRAGDGYEYLCGYTRTLSVEVGKPKHDDMSVDVPGNVTIYRMDRNDAPTLITKQNEKVRADQLRHLIDLSEKRRETPYIDTALTPPPAKWPWYVGGGAAALLLAAVGLWAWRRSRHRRPPP
jgi:hypothetical protein